MSDKNHFERVKDLFERAVEMAPEQRSHWLIQQCGEDTVVLEELQALIAELDRTYDHLEDGVQAVTASLTEHQTIGDFELVKRLPAGGMGVVFKARQKKFDRIVALKFPSSGYLASDRELQRFKAEAEAAAQLDHSGIVPIYETGVIEGHHYIAMRFVEGADLSQRLKRGPLAPREATILVAKICDAVDHAHRRGVIHRDLKPGNVLLSTTEGPLVADFGLAKRMDSDHQLTKGEMLGTPAYMSPEQVEASRDVTVSSDVYSIGAILYECLTGKTPFSGDDLLHQVKTQTPDSPRAIHPEVPKDLAAVALKCLEKKPALRYRTAAELATDLRNWLEHRPVSARPSNPGYLLWSFCRRRPILSSSCAAALTLIAVLCAATWMAWDYNGSSRARLIVSSIYSAKPSDVQAIIDVRLPPLRHWADDMLRSTALDPKSPDQLRSWLALAPVDSGFDLQLKKALVSTDPEEFLLVRDALYRRKKPCIPELWKSFRDSSLDEKTRFYAGLALAGFDPDSKNWKADDATFLVDQLFTFSFESQIPLRKAILPIKGKFVPPLYRSFEDPDAHVALSAEFALLEFAHDNPKLIAQLLCKATPEQWIEIVSAFESSAVRAEVESELRSLTKPVVQSDSRRRGSEVAAATAIRLRIGHADALADMRFHVHNLDFSAHFIHRARDRGVTFEKLFPALQKSEPLIQYILLLSLGDYPKEQLEAKLTSDLFQRLRDLYSIHPSAAVHGAAGWLLRKWGFDDDVDQLDRRSVPFDSTGKREWFILKVGDTYITFVVFPPCRFNMGLQAGRGQTAESPVHEVEFTYPFAIATTEFTMGQLKELLPVLDPGWRNFHALQHRATGNRVAADYPCIAISWKNATILCNELSRIAGLPMCYDQSNDELTLTTPGFRLPTEAEWELACRAGTTSSYYFGNDAELLGHYARHGADLYDTLGEVGRLMPNRRGLFDMAGGVREWCHDWLAKYPGNRVVDWQGGQPPPGYQERVLRGGDQESPPWQCTSSARAGRPPLSVFGLSGVRFAITLSGDRFR